MVVQVSVFTPLATVSTAGTRAHTDVLLVSRPLKFQLAGNVADMVTARAMRTPVGVVGDTFVAVKVQLVGCPTVAVATAGASPDVIVSALVIVTVGR